MKSFYIYHDDHTMDPVNGILSDHPVLRDDVVAIVVATRGGIRDDSMSRTGTGPRTNSGPVDDSMNRDRTGSRTNSGPVNKGNIS